MEPSGLELAPMWEAVVTGGSSMCYTTSLTFVNIVTMYALNFILWPLIVCHPLHVKFFSKGNVWLVGRQVVQTDWKVLLSSGNDAHVRTSGNTWPSCFWRVHVKHLFRLNEPHLFHTFFLKNL